MKQSFASEVIFDFYVQRSVRDERETLTFKRIQFSAWAGNRITCAFTCTRYEACTSFYVDDGACVFGLRDDVTELANGDDVTPADWQFVKTSRFSE